LTPLKKFKTMGSQPAECRLYSIVILPEMQGKEVVKIPK